MTDISPTTLTILIDADLKHKLETGAAAAHFSVDEFVIGLIEEALFINSPEYFDPKSWEAQQYHLVRESIRSGMAGQNIPLDDAEKALAMRFGAEGSGDLPSKS
ncbi:hypothetical protein [Mitsuaria sp. 7]|uniref:hypothetical protein n=1 Tax=Mitsuaria sp. 7 TaxID=1658665 RepID=UPI0012FB858A|nr:hypothetical protein [Mitsuaria sp. 7]